MIQKKVCMLGSFAVGKTSLVRRFVHSIFSEKYLTTVGVKIDKKEVGVGEQGVNMVLWDLHGEDEFQTVQMTYLRGSSGYLLVVDGTRGDTLDTVRTLQGRAEEAVGDVPFILLLNKADLAESWEVDAKEIEETGWTVMTTSAKTGQGVEEAFQTLARRMVER